ncbi:hypothetical protein SLS56_007596 [Neofusicoccum ribis]|uniref:Uncharacterized protein n=1 Tax=Neofusicoccum ribis TaxID=45134 RepID=A0ABR3SN19_9PEZI
MSNPTPRRRASTAQSDTQQHPVHPTMQQAPQPFLPPNGYLSLGQVYGPQPGVRQATMPPPAYRRCNFTTGYSGNPGHLYGDLSDGYNPTYQAQDLQYELAMMSEAEQRRIDNDLRYRLGDCSGSVSEKSPGFGHDAAFDHVNRTGRMTQDQLDYFIRRSYDEDMLHHRRGSASETARRLGPTRTARMPQNTEASTTAAPTRTNRFTAANPSADSGKQPPSLAERTSRPAHHHTADRELFVKRISPTSGLIPEKGGTPGKKSPNCKGEQSGMMNEARYSVQTTGPKRDAPQASHHPAPREFSMRMEETYSDLQRELVATKNVLRTIKEQLASTKIAKCTHKEHQTHVPAAHDLTAPKVDTGTTDRIKAALENLNARNKVFASRNRAQQSQVDKVSITVPDKSPRWIKEPVKMGMASSNAETFYDGHSMDSDSSVSEFSPINTPAVTPPAAKVVPDNKPAYSYGIPASATKKYSSSCATKPATKPAPFAMSQPGRDNTSLPDGKLLWAQVIKPAAKSAPVAYTRSDHDYMIMQMKKLASDKTDQPAAPKGSATSTAAPASQPAPLAAKDNAGRPATNTPFEDIAFAIDMHSFPDIVVAALGDIGCANLTEFWALPDTENHREEQFVLIEALMMESMCGLRRHYIRGDAEGREKIKKTLQWLLEAAGVVGAVSRE